MIFSFREFTRRWVQAHSRVLLVSSLFEIDIIKTEQNHAAESCPHLFCTRELWTACLGAAVQAEQSAHLSHDLV